MSRKMKKIYDERTNDSSKRLLLYHHSKTNFNKGFDFNNTFNEKSITYQIPPDSSSLNSKLVFCFVQTLDFSLPNLPHQQTNTLT